jgi:hypothetical protein
MCFQQAFEPYTIDCLKIGPKVKSIGQYAFRNDRLTYDNILIGTPAEMSQLQFSLNNPIPRFNKSATVDFYSEYYDASHQTQLSPFFQNAIAVNIT